MSPATISGPGLKPDGVFGVASEGEPPELEFRNKSNASTKELKSLLINLSFLQLAAERPFSMIARGARGWKPVFDC